MQPTAKSPLCVVQEDGKQPTFDYIRLQKSRFNLAGENEAVKLVLLLEDIEQNGPRGSVKTDGTIKLYVAREGQHCVAHTPHPDEPGTIFVLTAFPRSEFHSGLAEAWRLARKVFGFTT